MIRLARWVCSVSLRLRSLFRRRIVDRELSDEMQYHIERQVEENIARGMKPDEARYAALRAFGGLEQRKEACRDARGLTFINHFIQDVRYGIRTLRRNPVLTATAVLSLAVGIGANSAMFSIADAMLLRPLPVTQPGRVVTVGTELPLIQGINARLAISYPEYVHLRDFSRSFESLVAYTFWQVGFAAKPTDLQKLTLISLVSGNFFADMGVEPSLGRAFRPEEDQVPGRDMVVLLSHNTWEQQFAADQAILGRKLWLGGTEFTIIGVAPERFTGMDVYVHPAFYVPIMAWPRILQNTSADPLNNREERDFTVKGRLTPGVGIARAQGEMSAIAANLLRTFPYTNRNWSLSVRTETEARFVENPADSTLASILLLLAIAVLLAACANVGGLLTSHAPVRAREIAMRMAIGAGRGRLIRQLLTESLLIAIIGGLLGIVIGYGGVALFSRLQIASDLPISILIHLDERSLWVSLGVTLASVILFGLIPAIQTTRTDLATAMKPGETELLPERQWGRSLLVTGQVTVALVLVTLATFVFQGFRHHLSGAPGFRTDHLVTMGFDPSLVGYTKPRIEQFYQELLEHARSAPGVKSVALASYVPLTPEAQATAIVPEGFPLPAGQKNVSVLTNRVDESYFETMRVRMIRGREFKDTDNPKAPLVAIVNEQVAKHYWPGQSALGRRFRYGDSDTAPWIEIVGVAETSKYTFIAEPPQEFVYIPWRQHPRNRMNLLVESEGSSAALINPLRELVHQLDAGQPVFNVRTIEDLYDMRAVKLAGVITQTVGSMGLMGLALATVGLYGLIAYSVSRRTREIAIRVALGAKRREILEVVLRRGAALVCSGTAVGLIASLGAGRFLQGIFTNTFTTSATVLTCSCVSIALLVATMIAAYLPARRALRIDPIVALRYD